MKTLAELKENIYKCSRCGLCQSVCPIYKATGNECTLSRGKFILLNGVVQRHIPLNDDVLKYVDLCLNCNACKNFCPSNIDAREIMTAAKYEKNTKKNKFLLSFLNSYKFFKLKLLFASTLFNIYRFFHFDKFVSKMQNFIIKCGSFGKKILFLNSIAQKRINRKKYIKNSSKKTLKILYFSGCFNDYINNSSKNSVLNILDELNCEIVNVNFECCGISYYSKGLSAKIKKLAEINLAKIPEDFDYLVTDCASCKFMLTSYSEFVSDKYKQKAKMLAEKTIDIIELLEKLNYKKEFKNKNSFTFHKPCHFSGDIKEIISKLKNCEYKEMREYDTCCGASGEFMIKHNDISKIISTKKAENIINSGTDVAVTACPSCILGLKQGLLELNSNISVMNFIEYLNLD